MKRTYAKFLLPALAAALLFTGCAAKQTTEPAPEAAAEAAAQTITEEAASTASYFDLEDDTENAAEASTQEAAANTVTGVAKTQGTDGSDVADAFSDRDLSGDYDSGEAVDVRLTGTGAEAAADTVRVSGSDVVITGAGTYLLSGTLDGSVIVDADKEDKIQLVLDGVTIRAASYAAIYVKQADKVFITLEEGTENTLSNGGAFTQQDENNVDAVIFAKDDLTLNGKGSLTIASPAGHGIVGKDEVTITGGVYKITAGKCAIRANDSIAIADGTFTLTAGTDGLHAENEDDDTLGNLYIAGGAFAIDADDDAVHANTLLQIDDGSFEISGAEGLEATYVKINGGDISVSASDDGVNAARKSSAYTPTVEINGGSLTITMGPGDTDGVDANGSLIITGGTVNVTGQSAFDIDGSISFTGGSVIVNGQPVSSIPTQMMGGGFGGGRDNGAFGGGRGFGGEIRHG